MSRTIDIRMVIIGFMLFAAIFFAILLQKTNYGAARTGVSVVEWQSDTASWKGGWYAD